MISNEPDAPVSSPGAAVYEELVRHSLVLDLETTRQGATLRSIGALLGDRKFEWQRSSGLSREKALAELDVFSQGAAYVLGHNLLGHDLPFLRAAAPGLHCLQLPVIDTLYLSPLAFPQNPYHRLVKDYKLVRSTLSDPLQDCRLALTLFADQWESLLTKVRENPWLGAFYAHCCSNGRFNGFTGAGLALAFDLMGTPGITSTEQAVEVFIRLSAGRVCTEAPAGLGRTFMAGPAAAYALAWLTVSGGNSVLPPWVRHQFPEVVPLLKQLRDTPCGKPDCAYCRDMHDPDRQLKRFFGFNTFRAEPSLPDGESLQRAVVLEGMQDRPLLAILPTGGGKSLCYQLPGLARHARRGLLTVVISPLQALMQDQVDNLARSTGTPFAAGIHGMLTPPERGEVIERVRLGDIAILYLSPEQLRSNSVRQVLAQREIGGWVFDEAHCFSKWGHDFRPDYLYAARFMRELSQEQNLAVPPVACFTATAKLDVIAEIRDYFEGELKQELRLFEGGVERANLRFEVRPVDGPAKDEQVLAIVRRCLETTPDGSVIVYAATRKKTVEIRDLLLAGGLAAEAFHGSLDPAEKRSTIAAFVNGETRVICATNAFGMGIDKSNIRLVLHYDLPGSLENYLQEAGRAGRDLQPAECVLLYDPQDAEKQFKLAAFSEIKQEEIRRILKCLRRAKHNKDGDIVITTQELLRNEELAELFEKEDESNDARVRTAVSWLERADFLTRNQNLTQVFQGKPLVKNLEEAEPLIRRANLSEAMQTLWRRILLILFNAPPNRGLGADDIAEQLFPSREKLAAIEKQYGLTAAQLVLQAMHDMAALRLLDQGLLLSAFVRWRGHNNAPKLLASVGALEEGMLKFLQEEAPQSDSGEWYELDLRRLNQRLLNAGAESDPVRLRLLIKGLTLDGRGLAASHGSIELKHLGRYHYRVRLQRNWRALRETALLRYRVAEVILQVLVDKAKAAGPTEGSPLSAELLVEFGTNELETALRNDLFLHSQVQKPLPAIERALMFLQEQKIITLQHGLGVFRQAMTIRLQPHARPRQYTKGDFKPLAIHYQERRFQIHVIVEYAQLALERLAQALGLVLDYFSLSRGNFVKKYFADRKEDLQRATGIESYRKIVESLNNPIQIAVVGRPLQDNLLLLAGPGSGKTRVVVHRCAYLLRVERIPARQILIMCFNHSAAVELRRRLLDLVDSDAYGVTVATYHGAAMRLAGISLRELMETRTGEAPDFTGLLKNAVALLKGEKEIPGWEADEVRDQLLEGFSHILVDEYQDIDQDQYELVSAIAGRTAAEGDRRLAIMAVGDDDQNIYAFRGADLDFIRRFQKDYACHPVYMVENYRSTAHIVSAANQLIAGNRERMKSGQPIRINSSRVAEPAGGAWEKLDPVCRGHVQRLVVKDSRQQAVALLGELRRLKSLAPELEWRQCAVLCRSRKTVDSVRAVLEQNGVPLRLSLRSGLPLLRVREIHRCLAWLKSREKELCRPSALSAGFAPQASGAAPNPWEALLAELHDLYLDETRDAEQPVARFLDWLYEALAEQRQEKTLGQGVFLSTIHGAKGLEFEHVVIADGDWPRPAGAAQWEEERRLLYVGMSRAKQTLCLLELAAGGNPLIKELEGEWICRRPAPQADAIIAEPAARQYEVISPADIYLGYAGRFAAGSEIHTQLAQLGVGDELCLVPGSSGVGLYTASGFCVARLSAAGCAKWAARLGEVAAARIIGMLQWFADDSDEVWRDTLKTAAWEVPLVELVLQRRP